MGYVDYANYFNWGTPQTNNTNWLTGQFGGQLPNVDPSTLSSMGSQSPDWLSRQGFFGGKDANGFSSVGWGPALFGMGKSIFDGYLGLQQLDLAKDNLNFQKDAFSKQFENQRTLTNSELRDRQAARVASNPTAYQSVDDYMKANGV